MFLDLMGCDSVSYNEIYPGMNRVVSRLDPPPPQITEAIVKWQQHAHQHPVINYVQKTGDGSAHQITDFISQQQFRRLELYQECFRELKVEYQMSISVMLEQGQGILIGVAMNRQRLRFSETERLMANLLRPHVCEAYLTLVEMGHLRGLVEGLSAALEENGDAIVFWSHQGVVLNSSPRARELLSKFFGWRNGRTLPDALAAWAGKSIEEKKGQGGSFICEKAGTRLTARLARHTAFHYTTILLREEPLSPDPVSLVPLGISAREAEVLHWLSAGKSNAEIAGILGVSTLTAKTHVLNILRKLGVENRTAAAAVVHDFLKNSIAHSKQSQPFT